MNRTKKLSVSALVAALCVGCLALGSLLSNVSLSIAALAGLFPAAVVILCGSGWALGTYVVAAILGLLLLPVKTAAVWFACFFGHYPVWKALIEAWQTRNKQTALGWIFKLLGFALCVGLLYLAFRSFFTLALPFDLGSAGPILLALGLLAAFAVYDVAFSILIGWFRINVVPKMK
ncbi:MAG: hypothetical protein IKS05_00160 [Oscillospiraceae bacterium]|nr:hypothetical protein [Oscillospiraceae bacterium]